MLTDTALTIFALLDREILFFVFLLDVLLKSILIAFAANCLCTSFGRYFSSNARHLIWLSALLCIVSLPFLPTLFQQFVGENLLLPKFKLLIFAVSPATISLNESQQFIMENREFYWLAFYAVVLVVLLLRLLLSARRLQQINSTITNSEICSTKRQLQKLCTRKGLNRHVGIGFSDQADSPFSFGLIRPQIVLPAHARLWSASTINNVLAHELNHIVRHDWIINLLSYVLTSLSWLNPAAWFVLRKMSNEAEYCCDNAVLDDGVGSLVFAEDLVKVARSSQLCGRTELLAQSMIDRNGIYYRLENILDPLSRSRTVGKSTALSLALFTLVVLTVSSCTELLSVGSYDGRRESVLVYSEPAVYPSKAEALGTEGYVTLNFIVDDKGAVIPEKINVEHSQPPGVFEAASIDTLEKFKFTPKKINGRSVSSHVLRYTFHYEIDYKIEYKDAFL